MSEASTEQADPLEQARAELSQWCNLVVDAIVRGDTAKPTFIASYIPLELARRIDEALGGCRTPEDVQLTFASVQNHQLLGVPETREVPSGQH